MNLLQFIELVIKDYALDVEAFKCVKAVTNYAKRKAENGCACLSEDDVREFILNNVENIKKEKIIKAPVRKEPEPVKEKKVKENEIENLTLF